MTVMLFAGSIYYPKGGWHDYVGTFDSIEAAKAGFAPDRNGWATIVVDGKIVWEFDPYDERWREGEEP